MSLNMVSKFSLEDVDTEAPGVALANTGGSLRITLSFHAPL